MSIVLTNFQNTTLAAASASGSTSFTLSSSANLPTLTAGQIMPLVLNDAATGTIYEVVYVTAISGAVLTVTRAQEGTTAQNWNIGDFAYCAPTAETLATINGSSSQVFNAANATAGTQEVVPISQADTRYTPSGADGSGLNYVTITGNTTLTLAAHSGKILDTWGVPANTVITAPLTGGNTTPVGFNVIIGPFTNAGCTLLNPATSTVAIYLPDGSSVAPGGSFSFPSGTGHAFRLYEFSSSLRLETIGRTIVANAVNSNEAVALGQVLGVGKSWINVLASRAYGTVYTNNYNYPIGVSVSGNLAAGNTIILTIQGVVVSENGSPASNGNVPVFGIVPPGATYEITGTSSFTLSTWTELY